MANSSPTLAIDFGTSNSLAGAWFNGQRVEAMPLDKYAPDPSVMRTLLYFPTGDKCFFGAQAIAQYIEDEMEGRLFRSFKSHLPNRSYLGTFVGNRPLPLEDMIGIFLLEMKRRCEVILDRDIDTAVIGRPARYSMDPLADSFALHRMQKAAEFAGLKNVEFVPEPLAAALDFRRGLNGEKVALIGDFGGGTSDFTIIRLGPYDYKKEHVLGIEGCPLAGDALDSLFMSHRLNAYFGANVEYRMSLGRNVLRMPAPVMERLNRPAHIVHLKEPATYAFINDVRRGAVSDKDKASIERLFVLLEDQQIFSFFEAIEQTKRELSSHTEAPFEFDYPDIEVSSTFDLPRFESWAADIKTGVFESLDRCLTMAGLKDSEIDLVCLTGGSGQVPLIRNELVRRFGAEKLQTQAHFHSVLSGLIEHARLVQGS